jgi:ubiquinone/menaquinone biosynthesis C-methylase UbiE
MIKPLIGRFARVVPYPVQLQLKRWGLFRFLFFFYDKPDAELAFQRDWAVEFKQNRGAVLEYWKRYRDLDRLVTVCQIEPRSRVLDVGCGISTVLHFVPGKRFGIDPLADEYRKLYDYPAELSIRKGSGEVIPFPDNDFDTVFCCNVLDHVTDPLGTLAEIHRVLKGRGHLVLIVEIFPEAKLRDPAHPHSLTRASVQTLLQERFEIVYECTAPWVGLRAYVHGARSGNNEELIVIARKLSGG